MGSSIKKKETSISEFSQLANKICTIEELFQFQDIFSRNFISAYDLTQLNSGKYHPVSSNKNTSMRIVYVSCTFQIQVLHKLVLK
jgi:hypothetical protein